MNDAALEIDRNGRFGPFNVQTAATLFVEQRGLRRAWEISREV